MDTGSSERKLEASGSGRHYLSVNPIGFFVRENERSRLLGLGKCQLLPQLNAIRCEATDFHLKTGTGSFDSVPI